MTAPDPTARTWRPWIGRFVVVALAGGMLLLLLKLGFWQLERADFKDDLVMQFERNDRAPAGAPATLLQGSDVDWYFRKTRTDGRFDPLHQYLLDNQTHNGQAGYHVLSPFHAPGGTVMVNRGWVPVGDSRAVLPDLEIAGAPTVLSGRLVTPTRSGLLLGSDGYDANGWPRVVQRIDLPRMAGQVGSPLLPAILLLDADHPACNVCEWTPVLGIGPERHRGYAVQWFALAAAFMILLAITAWLEWRRRDP